jgi:hypothetical protein
VNAEEAIGRLQQSETPDWALKLIKEGPIAGVKGGCHNWLYRAARGLFLYRRKHNLTESDIFTVLRAKADRYGRCVWDHEIEDAITSAIRDLDIPERQAGNARKAWPKPDFERVDKIVMSGFGFNDLKEASPVMANQLTTENVVSELFPGDPFLCAAKDKWNAFTRPLSEWLIEPPYHRLSRQAYIVPNRMTRRRGTNKKGEPSARCLDNTGPRDYLVIECDISKFDLQGNPTPWKPWIEKWKERGLTVADACAAILRHLHEEAKAPLVLAVHSGGKSIHGWFPVQSVTEEKLSEFMQYSVLLGADEASWSHCQLVRMPGGLRVPKVRQQILYYDPKYVVAGRVEGSK